MDLSRTGFGQFMASGIGRLARIIVGLALVAWGYMLLNSVAGIVLIIVGLVPLAAGIFDFCVVSALLGGPFWGVAIRKVQSPKKIAPRVAGL